MKSVSTKLFAASCAMAASAAAFAVPTVSDVTFAQEVPTRKVTITYKLSGDPGIVTVDVRTNGVSIGSANLTHFVGDVNKIVQPGDETRTVIWQPDLAWPNHKVDNSTVVVTAWSKEAPPPYWVIDLSAAHDGNPDTWRFYASAEEVPNGVTDRVYKSRYLVLRKIPAACVEWRMGAMTDEWGRNNDWQRASTTPHNVSFTKDYYIGIYELTNEQYKWMVGACPDGVGWTDHEEFPYMPANGSGMQWGVLYSWNNPSPGGDPQSANNPVAKMRTQTGVPTMSFPSAAQWQYACRAGTATATYNGQRLNKTADTAMKEAVGEIAWYGYNSDSRVHEVGLKKPNAFGLYDTLGNVQEWFWDYADTNMYDGSDAIDPQGPNTYTESTSGGARTNSGTSYAVSDIFQVRASVIGYGATWDGGNAYGMRLSCAAVIP